MFYLFLTAITLIFILSRWRRSSTSKIPEPGKLPLIGNTFQLFGLSDNVWYDLQALNKKYPIYNISHPIRSAFQLSDADDLQIFLAGKDHTDKSFMYNLVSQWLGTGLLTSKGAKWQYRRKLLTPAFHFNILQEFFNIFKEHSDILVDKLQEDCNKPHIDIFSLISHHTLNIICETAMGIKLDESKAHMAEYVNGVQRIGEILLTHIRKPWLYFKVFFFTSSYKKKELSTLKVLHNFTLSVIEEQKKAFKDHEIDENFVGKKRLALLDLLVTMKYRGAAISDEGIREEVDTFTFEGHDTTAVAISFALMLIANHEDVQNKILDEIKEVTDNFTKDICFNDLSKLRYLEMVIKEALRLYPSVPIIGRKTSTDVHTATGYFIPKGSNVGLHIYSVHHNEKYFKNPEKFDPERFLPENCYGRHPFAYIPFSAGPRNCIGQRFAMMELKTIISSIVQHFRLIPIDTPSTITMVSNLTLKTVDGIKIKIERRV